MAGGKQIHVAPDGTRWGVKREGAARAESTHDTQSEAEKVAKEVARREGLEVVIHGKGGQIRDSDSFGKDSPSEPDRVH